MNLPATAQEPTMPIVETRHGRLRGSLHQGIAAFKGIPYAAPPVGALRWRPPADPLRWSGVRDAIDYGPWAPQRSSTLDGVMGAEQAAQSEDCLTLNLWSPGLDQTRRPVMVWIHGGSFARGSGGQGLFEGHALSRHGDLVVVTLNYRLGVFGFSHLATATAGAVPATGNEGLLDQIKALQWVQDNIEHFGGDPHNVTLFGESAGAMAIGALLTSPAARGLFHKAILQSGACHSFATLASAPLLGEALLKATGLDADRLCMASTAELLLAQQSIEHGQVEGYPLARIGGLPFRPVVDGTVLPVRPYAAIEAGVAAGIPLMVGTTADEWRLFGALQPAITGLSEANLFKRLGYFIDHAQLPALVDSYRQTLVARGIEPTPPELFMAIQTDRVFRIPALRLLERQQPHEHRLYSYLFDWKSPAAGGALGACHAIELAYVFGTHTKPGAAGFFGTGAAADALARQCMSAWSAFARNGDPGWPAYDSEQRATMILGERCRSEQAPFDRERAAWESIDDLALGSLA
jgi:para-nitrobenzyl esterase